MRGAGLFISAFTLAALAACGAPPAAPPARPAPEPAPATVQEPEPKKPAPGVVATSAEVPPKRDPTAEDVLKLQKEIVARRPASDDEKLRLALLQASVGNLEEAERVLSTLKLRSNRMLPYVELYVRRQLGDHQEAGALLARLQEDERAVVGFGIERAELVTRVRRYRDYVPAEGDRVAPGGEVHLYVEPRNFAAQRAGERQTFHLRYEWKLLDDRGSAQPVPAWDEAPADAREDRVTSNGPVAEFYQSFRLPLPANLAAGRYKVRITVTDVVSGKSARQDVPITVLPVERSR